jgi:hypothetical protein
LGKGEDKGFFISSPLKRRRIKVFSFTLPLLEKEDKKGG